MGRGWPRVARDRGGRGVQEAGGSDPYPHNHIRGHFSRASASSISAVRHC